MNKHDIYMYIINLYIEYNRNLDNNKVDINLNKKLVTIFELLIRDYFRINMDNNKPTIIFGNKRAQRAIALKLTKRKFYFPYPVTLYRYLELDCNILELERILYKIL